MTVRQAKSSAGGEGKRPQRRASLRDWGIGAGELAATGLLAACSSTASAPPAGGTTSLPTMTTLPAVHPTSSGRVAVTPSTAAATAPGSVTGINIAVSIYFNKLVTLQPIFSNKRAVDKRTGSFWRGRFLDIAGAAEFDEGKAVTDQAKRKEAYLQVAKILNDEVPMAYL